MPLLVRDDSTQRVPVPAMWPNKMPMPLPDDQPAELTISFTTKRMSGVTRSSWTFAEISGCQITEAGYNSSRRPSKPSDWG